MKGFILYLFKNEGFQVDTINFIFCSDSHLHALNKEYLKHDTYTDIVTFHYSQPPQSILSDIYISVDRIRENAKTFDVPFIHELYRVMFHGALHLCGYKDKSGTDQTLMRAKENFYLGKYVPREIKVPKS